MAARKDAGLAFDGEALRGFKLDLVRALAPDVPAMLLDPEIGLPHVLDEGAFPAHTGLLVSLERSGAVRSPDGLRAAELLPDLGASGVRRLGGTGAKLLVRLRADREGPDGANAAVIRTAVADCAASSLLLVVEVLVYAARRRGRLDLRGAARRPDPRGGPARRGMRRALPQARVPGRRRRHARA